MITNSVLKLARRKEGIKTTSLVVLGLVIILTLNYVLGVLSGFVIMRKHPTILDFMDKPGELPMAVPEALPMKIMVPLPVAPVVPEPEDDGLGSWGEPQQAREFSDTTTASDLDSLPQHVMLMTTQLFEYEPVKLTGDVGDVPMALAQVIVDEVEGTRNRSFIASLSYGETKYNDPAIRKACGDDNGHAKGGWQHHDTWAEKTAKHCDEVGEHALAADIRAGICEDPVLNLRGLRALLKIQKTWHPGGYHNMAAYYNEGGSFKGKKGQAYADAVMTKMEELIPHFESL